MTEKEKMLAGKLYFAGEEELIKERLRAKEMVYLFNTLPPASQEERHKILIELLGNAGENIYIEPPFRCDYGYNISVGKNFYANYNLTVLDCAQVEIGNCVMLAPNVSILAAGHPLDAQWRNTGLEYGQPVKIGSNVWIGAGAIINPGVTIGDNVVIGSGSVVTKDIPADVVAVGNPCRVLRPIQPKDKVYYFKDKKAEE